MMTNLHFRNVLHWLLTIDYRLLTWIRAGSNLLIALVNVTLAVWALLSGHGTYVIIMALIGATGYFLGLVVASTCVVSVLVISVAMNGFPHGLTDDLILHLFSYISVVWLAFRHKHTKEEQQRVLDDVHPDQIVPWTAVNEVRTSLAAVRYLLFPLHSENSSNELQEATNELVRLERLFKDLEEKQDTI